MDLQNPLIVLRKVASDRYFVQQTIDLFLNPWDGLLAQYTLRKVWIKPTSLL